MNRKDARRHAGSDDGRGLQLQTALTSYLLSHRLFHPLQARPSDHHGAIAAGSDLAPCSQHDVDVVMGGVAMLGRKPGSETASRPFQLGHRSSRQAAEIETSP